MSQLGAAESISAHQAAASTFQQSCKLAADKAVCSDSEDERPWHKVHMSRLTFENMGREDHIVGTHTEEADRFFDNALGFIINMNATSLPTITEF